LEESQPPRVLEGHSDWVGAVAVTPDGRYAVSGSYDNTLRVWDLKENQPPRVLEGHSAGIQAVALAPDGRYAVSGSSDNSLRVWDLHDFRCLAAFTCDAPVWCCAWGGLRVVAGDQSGKVHLFAWEEEPAARR
jgi:WD40 repeat protein